MPIDARIVVGTKELLAAVLSNPGAIYVCRVPDSGLLRFELEFEWKAYTLIWDPVVCLLGSPYEMVPTALIFERQMIWMRDGTGPLWC